MTELRPPEEVRVAPIPPDRFKALLDEDEWREFQEGIRRALELFEGRVIWMLNSTAAGGGVAEMLRSLLAYTRGAGVNVRWMVMSGTPEFFRITKRLHNHLHGSPGDGGVLGDTGMECLRGRLERQRGAGRRGRTTHRHRACSRSADGGNGPEVEGDRGTCRVA